MRVSSAGDCLATEAAGSIDSTCAQPASSDEGPEAEAEGEGAAEDEEEEEDAAANAGEESSASIASAAEAGAGAGAALPPLLRLGWVGCAFALVVVCECAFLAQRNKQNNNRKKNQRHMWSQQSRHGPSGQRGRLPVSGGEDARGVLRTYLCSASAVSRCE